MPDRHHQPDAPLSGDRPTLYSVFGVSGAGKSTAMKMFEACEGFGLIRVGDEMRRRHSLEDFKGKAAMEETEAEVWEIFDAQYQQAVANDCRAIAMDGQPRLVPQVYKILRTYGRFTVLWLHCDDEELRARASQRSNSQEEFELHFQRLTNDRVQLFDVIHLLSRAGVTVAAFDTGRPDWLKSLRRYCWA